MSRISIMAQPGPAFIGAFNDASDRRLAQQAAQMEQAAAQAQARRTGEIMNLLVGGTAPQSEQSAPRQASFDAGVAQGGAQEAPAAPRDLSYEEQVSLAAQLPREEQANAFRFIDARQRQTQAQQERENTIFQNGAQAVASGRDVGVVAQGVASRLGIPVEEAQERLGQFAATTEMPARYERIERGDPRYPAGGRGTYQVNLANGQVTAVPQTAPQRPQRGITVNVPPTQENVNDNLIDRSLYEQLGLHPNGVYMWDRNRRPVRIDDRPEPEEPRFSLLGVPMGDDGAVSSVFFGQNIQDVYQMIEESPAENFGTSGAIINLSQQIMQQVPGLENLSLEQLRGEARAAGVAAEDADAFFDDRIPQIEQSMRLLAFSAASMIAEQEGRALSDKDLNHFIRAIGNPLSLTSSRREVLARLRGIDRQAMNRINANRVARGLERLPDSVSWLDGSAMRAAQGLPAEAPEAAAGALTAAERAELDRLEALYGSSTTD